VPINPQNLVMGPARLYYAAFGTAEPADSTVTPDGWLVPPPAPWTDFGGTDGGVSLEVDTTYTDLEVDQEIMPVGSRLTAMAMSVAAKLSEVTQANMAVALNNITQAGSGAGYITLDIPVGSSTTQPQYSALIIDGWGPELSNGQPALRRAIVRKVLSTAKVTLASDKKTQQAFDCTFKCFYVGPGINPIHIIDQLELARVVVRAKVLESGIWHDLKTLISNTSLISAALSKRMSGSPARRAGMKRSPASTAGSGSAPSGALSPSSTPRARAVRRPGRSTTPGRAPRPSIRRCTTA